jgi:lysophospholipase L1-like esterase
MFVGSMNRTCTPKKPREQFAQDPFDQPHEGHCSWNARQLSEHVLALIEHQSKGRALVEGDPAAGTPTPRRAVFLGGDAAGDADRLFESRTKQAAAAHYAKQCRGAAVDVALLLIGHNDAFQAARKCKIKESAAGSAVAATNVRDTSPGALKDTRGAACVSQFLVDFETNVVNLVDGLFEAYPGMRLVVGLNPTTNFPIVDVILHQILLSVVGEHGRGRSGVATFGDWSRRHTFDSTHPNEFGARYMASRWYEAMRQLPVPLIQLIGGHPDGKEEERSVADSGAGNIAPRREMSDFDRLRREALEEGHVVARLQGATPHAVTQLNVAEYDGDDERFPFYVSRLLFLMFSVTFLLAVTVRRVRTSLRGLLSMAIRTFHR